MMVQPDWDSQNRVGKATQSTGTASPSDSMNEDSSGMFETASAPMTREQADQILAEIKSIKKNFFWLLLILGFFAARALFFHY